MTRKIHQEPIGKTPNGKTIKAYTLQNERGLRATFLNYGGILVELEVPDRSGMPVDITLGRDSVEEYVDGNPGSFGAIIGRFANRIAHGKFDLDGKTIQLPLNEAHAHLHGGPEGFGSRLFKATVGEEADGPVLIFSYTSPNGEMGYPGKLQLEVRISLTPQNGLLYRYQATTTKPTILNLTCHPYFNLAGQDSGSIRQHVLQIAADHYLPIHSDTRTPTGVLEPVNDGPFDFRNPEQLDRRLDSPNAQVELVRGFDHTFVFNKDRDPDEPVAVVTDENSGRRMEVFTSEPGVQLYTANHFDESLAGKNGYYYPRHAGFCLETQHFPDSPNFPAFPSTRLDPGETFTSFTEYRFSAV